MAVSRPRVGRRSGGREGHTRTCRFSVGRPRRPCRGVGWVAAMRALTVARRRAPFFRGLFCRVWRPRRACIGRNRRLASYPTTMRIGAGMRPGKGRFCRPRKVDRSRRAGGCVRCVCAKCRPAVGMRSVPRVSWFRQKRVRFDRCMFTRNRCRSAYIYTPCSVLLLALSTTSQTPTHTPPPRSPSYVPTPWRAPTPTASWASSASTRARWVAAGCRWLGARRAGRAASSHSFADARTRARAPADEARRQSTLLASVWHARRGQGPGAA